jgi:hypothetical protein
MEHRGFSSTAKALLLGLKQNNASNISRRVVVEMSSIGFCKAVAAATGREFKSRRAD